MSEAKRPAPTKDEAWAATSESFRVHQEELRSDPEADQRYLVRPQETFSPDSTFEELPEYINRQCCVGKSCGYTDLFKRLESRVIDGKAVLSYEYARGSNGDVYFSSPTLEGLIKKLNDATHWPNRFWE